MAPPKLQPALLGGVAIGMLSALPVVNVANCCCLWIVGGGALAAHLMQHDHPRPITAADGALVGLLSGLFGALVWLVVSVPLQALLGPLQAQLFERALEGARDLPPEARGWLDGVQPTSGLGLATAIGFIVMLVTGVPFGALGGALGAVLFRKPDVPPPPPLPSDGPPMPPPMHTGGAPAPHAPPPPPRV